MFAYASDGKRSAVLNEIRHVELSGRLGFARCRVAYARRRLALARRRLAPARGRWRTRGARLDVHFPRARAAPSSSADIRACTASNSSSSCAALALKESLTLRSAETSSIPSERTPSAAAWASSMIPRARRSASASTRAASACARATTSTARASALAVFPAAAFAVRCESSATHRWYAPASACQLESPASNLTSDGRPTL